MTGKTAPLHRNAQRVQRALRPAGSHAGVQELPGSARTAQEAAAGLGVRWGGVTSVGHPAPLRTLVDRRRTTN
jgi:hypothetical protein